MIIGERIREIRKQRGLKGRVLASMAGISPEYLSRLELGKNKNPSIRVIEKVALVLDEPIYNFFSEDSLVPEKHFNGDVSIKIPWKTIKKKTIFIKLEGTD
jgi:transcriptional regulator with XRE-family HTH domain